MTKEKDLDSSLVELIGKDRVESNKDFLAEFEKQCEVNSDIGFIDTLKAIFKDTKNHRYEYGFLSDRGLTIEGVSDLVFEQVLEFGLDDMQSVRLVNIEVVG